MIFNNIDFTEHFIVETIERPLLPDIGAVTVPIPGSPGFYFVRESVGGVKITLNVRLLEENRDNLNIKIREIAGLLRTKEPKKLILRDEPDKHNWAFFEGDIEVHKYEGVGYITLEPVCYDPHLYSNTESQENNIDGRTLFNGGSEETPGVFTAKVDGDRDHIRFILFETGEYVYAIHDFKNDDEIILDTKREVLEVNGSIIEVTLESDFFKLPVGGFTINTTGLKSVNLTFTERWF